MNNIEERKFRGLLGIAAKAGKVQSGEFCTERSLKAGRARLCLVASDASEPTKKRFRDMCKSRNIPIATEVLDKEALGHTIGKEMRASAAIEDEGLAEGLKRLVGAEALGKELSAVPAEGQEGGYADDE